jgi:hypothetical protein
MYWEDTNTKFTGCNAGAGTFNVKKQSNYFEMSFPSLNSIEGVAINWKSLVYGTVNASGSITANGAPATLCRFTINKNGVALATKTGAATTFYIEASTTVIPNDVISFSSADDAGGAGCTGHSLYNAKIESFAVTATGLTLRLLDEITGNPIQFANNTIANISNSTIYNIYNYSIDGFLSRNGSELPSNDITISTIARTCTTANPIYMRSILLNTFTMDHGQTMYLLCDGSAPIFTRVNVWTQTQAPLTNVTIIVRKLIGTQYPVITSGITNENGIFPMYLQTNDRYILSLSRNGFTPVSIQIVAAQNDFYAVMLSNSTAVLQTIFNGIGRTITPSTLSLPNSTAASLQYNITTNGTTTVDWFSMNLSYSNGTTAYFYNNTNPLGGSITGLIDTSNVTDFVRADFNFSRTGYGQYNETYFYHITQFNASYENQSLKGMVKILSQSQGGRFVKATIALGITFMIVLVIAPFSTVGAGFAALVSMAYFITAPNIIVLPTDKNGFGTANPQAAMLIFITLVVVALTVRRSGL